ncbi:MAG: hypothetical protein AVDCRST_MAG05-5168 [uncultured Rubrobacteraceae bacterium]|uniref:DUF3105 domain-containing protein n=1 Tax=uncultured Rubrobacteraceae bacterium TaxID=349277 RepID=A0A6J4U3B9_9ACTN|nr:MAG: hypothetical protein AVDCRST_MAG05-5168 [uncultured Rubrobacteraceae bacterium]
MSIWREKRGIACVFLTAALVIFAAACGGETSGGSQGSSNGGAQKEVASGTPAAEATQVGGTEETTAAPARSGEAAELAKAEVSPKEVQNMLPADGKRPDPARPLPEDPPEGIEVYPATTNKLTEGPIEYDRSPPTNGKHDPLWQNCGAYERPIKDRHAVHSMDHGVVWIAHSPDLPAGAVDTLRSYGDERYVMVSPYPGLDAPVVATSWRVQLELDGADDPRLREFVDGFRSSELAPLSGNRCEGGVGNPQG